MMVYGWTITWCLWKIPSWTYFLTPGDILGILAYSFAIDFLESLAILLLILVVSLLLPGKWIRDSFIARGVAAAVLFLGYLMYFSYSFKTIEVNDYPQRLASLTPAVIGLISFLVFLVGRIAVLRRAVEEFSTRAVIFLYISVPISAIALLLVVGRNLF